MDGGLEILKRRLPHWRLQDSVYFVTWSIVPGLEPLVDPERDMVAGALHFFHGQRYLLWAYVAMDDHVHVLLTPKSSYTLSSVVHSWKSFTANKINRLRSRKGRFWQVEYHDRIVRSEEDFSEKMEYILTNPVRRWPGTHDYKWAEWLKDGFQLD